MASIVSGGGITEETTTNSLPYTWEEVNDESTANRLATDNTLKMLANVVATSGGGNGGSSVVVDYRPEENQYAHAISSGWAYNVENTIESLREFTGARYNDNWSTEVQDYYRSSSGSSKDLIERMYDLSIQPKIPVQLEEGQIVNVTEEKIIGKWLDGKPLYEKTVAKQVTSSITTTNGDGKTGYIDAFNFSNLNVVDFNGSISTKQNGILFTTTVGTSYPLNYYDSDKLFVRTYVWGGNSANDPKTGVQIWFNLGDSVKYPYIILTIRYTKIEDYSN